MVDQCPHNLLDALEILVKRLRLDYLESIGLDISIYNMNNDLCKDFRILSKLLQRIQEERVKRDILFKS